MEKEGRLLKEPGINHARCDALLFLLAKGVNHEKVPKCSKVFVNAWVSTLSKYGISIKQQILDLFWIDAPLLLLSFKGQEVFDHDIQFLGSCVIIL